MWIEVGSGLAGSTESIFRTHPSQGSDREEGRMVSEPWVQGQWTLIRNESMEHLRDVSVDHES